MLTSILGWVECGGGVLMIEVQCTSCHTRYRIDEQVLPEGIPTFKCSRCGHVFSFEPRTSRVEAKKGAAEPNPTTPMESGGQARAREVPQPESRHAIPSAAADPIPNAPAS